MALSDVDLRIIWVRAGGHCVLCKKYLLQGEITDTVYPLGEGAHVVGRKDSARSPRGKDDPLPVTERDTPENVLLACEKCHGEIDVLLNEKVVDKAFLLRLKTEHEAEMRRLTGMIGSVKTAVVRMVADVRGRRSSLSSSEAVLAVIRNGRIPTFVGAYDGSSEEIDLRDILGETGPSAAYYEQAAERINDIVDRRIAEAIRREEATHLSIFGIARVPLLIYLGNRLDDAVAVQLFQRHRSTDSWVWPETDPGTDFKVNNVRQGVPLDGIALITNLSGTTPVRDLPEDLSRASVFELSPTGGSAEDVIAHPAVLDRFVDVVRAFFTEIEATHKEASEVHLFGALPISPAVALGRVLKGTGIRPSLVTYDRTDEGYVKAMVI